MIRERYCQDCGRIFEAEDEDDRYCKRCLLVRYRALVARPGPMEDANDSPA